MTMQLPAPESVLQLVKCGCKSKCHSQRCSYRRVRTALHRYMQCSDYENSCENVCKDADNENDENMDEEV